MVLSTAINILDNLTNRGDDLLSQKERLLGRIENEI